MPDNEAARQLEARTCDTSCVVAELLAGAILRTSTVAATRAEGEQLYGAAKGMLIERGWWLRWHAHE